jgi:hypothetical protein
MLCAPLRLAPFIQLMDRQKAVLLQPLSKDEMDHFFSRHLQFFAGGSDRGLNVIIEGHQSLTFSALMAVPSATTRDDALAYEPRLEGRRTPLVSPLPAIGETRTMDATPNGAEAFIREVLGATFYLHVSAKFPLRPSDLHCPPTHYNERS